MLLSPRATVTVEPTPSSSSSSSSSSWDSMLPGPPNRNNFGSSDLSPHGLLAFPSGSSLSIIDTRSMQLLSSFPIPPPSSATSSLSPFVTALRWTPLPLNRDLLSTEPSSSHLFLAAGDRQGRIALLDFRIKSAVIWFDTDSKLDSTIQNIGISYSDVPSSPYLREDFDNPFDFCDESIIVSKMHLISISDDGKIWDWLLTTEGHAADTQKDDKKLGLVNDDSKISFPEATSNSIISSTGGRDPNLRRQKVRLNDSKSCLSSSILNQEEMLIKISLVGQLQLLSSTVTMLAVPTPSLTATLAQIMLFEGGGNYPAAAVPLVALGTQNGTIEVVDVSANAVASSLSVHNGIVRGLRWLGNSRLVSFSYSQANEKSGGYINKLAVTCLRSGLNKMFRVLQKPERAPIRALRTSSSGRYLLILFRDAPVEVWAMTKSPIMLRSLALPFTVLEWTLPTVPRPAQNAASRDSSLSSKEQTSGASDEVFTSSKISSSDSKGSSTEGFQDDTSESFAFALVNGALGVFEVQGRRIRDFREGIRRIKFSPFVPGDHSRGRIAVLFYDNTFSVFDLDSPDPLANSLLQPQFPGTLVLELDWLPLRTDKNDPLVLCIAGADSSFRLVEITANDKRSGHVPRIRNIKERFRSMPICCPIILPTPHALAVRMILQLGVKPSWFNTCSTTIKKRPHLIPGTPSSVEDLRTYMINIPPLGDSVVPEMLLKVLEPYRKEGCILDDERAKLYASILDKGCAARFAFAATIFGESSEALFWLQLRRAFKDAMNKLWRKPPPKGPSEESVSEVDETSLLSRILSKGKPTEEMGGCVLSQGQLRSMTFDQEELWKSASERISWHEKLEGEEAIQKRVHEALILYVAAGALQEALTALRKAQLPDTAAMFVLACREIHAEIVSNLGIVDDDSSSSVTEKLLNLRDLDPENEDVIAVDEYFGEYQRKLVHLCMDSQPFSD
ncbi:hypothetical protein TanjilG_07005 [Lupinus angustifolius]|uniref:Uncharacterized protein n=1 Tax=Lupinus angustifolius TaxID=3871 RepID=A0A1J7J2X7_LUPAN|nr:hypothetical protein TanjilG_07005 [Lupinus angustifolius]